MNRGTRTVSKILESRVPRPWKAVVLVTAAFLACAGCDSDEVSSDPDVASLDEPTAEGLLELGAFGESRAFFSYQPGDEEEIEMGLQGAYHIFVDGRLRPDDAPDELVLEMVLHRHGDGEEITTIRHQRMPDIDDMDGWPTLPEMIIFIPDPQWAAEQDADLRVEARDLDGQLLDSVEVTLGLHGPG